MPTSVLSRLGAMDHAAGNRIDRQAWSTIQVIYRVVDSHGRVLTFRVDDTSRRIQGLRDPAGRCTSYGYAGANLASAVALAGKTGTSGHGTVNRLTRITPQGSTSSPGMTSRPRSEGDAHDAAVAARQRGPPRKPGGPQGRCGAGAVPAFGIDDR